MLLYLFANESIAALKKHGCHVFSETISNVLSIRLIALYVAKCNAVASIHSITIGQT